MIKTSKRHSNDDFRGFTNLILADVLMSGMIGMIFLGIWTQGEEGLQIYLPPYYYEAEDTIKISSSDILHLDIDSSSQLLINDTLSSFTTLENSIQGFYLKKRLENKRSYIWIRVSRDSRYFYYIQLRDAIKRVERTIANDLSIRYYGQAYSHDMPLAWRKRMNKKMSLFIIEEYELGKPYFETRSFMNLEQAIDVGLQLIKLY